MPRAGPDTASATAASTVPLQVRKSLALNSPPAAALTYSLMSADFTSTQRPAVLVGEQLLAAAAALLEGRDDRATSGSPIAWTRRLPALRLVVEGDLVAVDVTWRLRIVASP